MKDTRTLTYSSCPMCDSKSIGSHMEVKDHSISKETFPLWICKDCGFTFTQNPPIEADCGPYYESEDYISHSDKKEGIRDHLYHSARAFMLGRKAGILKKYVETSKPGSLLDVGSGTGYFLNHMHSNGWTVQGIEVNDKARSYCHRVFNIDAVPPSELFQLEMQYDAITLWHVLEHLYDFHKYIAQFKALIKPNGKLVIAVPNHSSRDALHYKSNWAAYDVPRHLWHFQPSDFELLAKKHGLNLIAKHAMPLDAFYVSMLSEQYKNGAPLISGGIQGMLSNLRSIGNPDKSSSVIYVIGK